MSVYVALTVKDDETHIEKVLEQCSNLGLDTFVFDARLSKEDTIPNTFASHSNGIELSDLEIYRTHISHAKEMGYEWIWFLNGDSEVLAEPKVDNKFDLISYDYSVLAGEKLERISAFEIEREIEVTPNCADSWIAEKVGLTMFNKIFKIEKLLTSVRDLGAIENGVFSDIILSSLYLRETTKIKFDNENIVLIDTKNFITNKKWEPLRLNAYICNLPETIKYMDKIYTDFEKRNLIDLNYQAVGLIHSLLLKMSEYEDKDSYFKVLCGILPQSIFKDMILYSDFEDSAKISMMKIADSVYGQN